MYKRVFYMHQEISEVRRADHGNLRRPQQQLDKAKRRRCRSRPSSRSMQVAMLHLDQRLNGGCRLGLAAVVSIGRFTAIVAVHMLQLLRRRHASLACVLCSVVTGQSIQQLARCYMHARLENQSRCFTSCTRVLPYVSCMYVLL